MSDAEQPGAEDAERSFRDVFQLDALTLHRDEHWTVSLRPSQPVLGALVISTNHGSLGFSDLPAASGPGLVELLGAAEAACRQHFGAVRLNVLCLMMKDPLLHFHVLPRYAAPVVHGGEEWTDPGWPGAPDLTVDQAAGGSRLAALLETYQHVAWL